MKFEHLATRDDGGGKLIVTAESAQEWVEVCKHFRLYRDDPLGLAESITRGDRTYTHEPKKRPWFAIGGELGPQWLEPYRTTLERMTGYSGALPDLELTQHHPRRLCHTHITASCSISGGCYRYFGLIQSEDWNGRAAADRAPDSLEDYISESIGDRKHEPEFIENRNGTYSRNPNYPKRHKAHPALSASWLWAALWDWWRENHATAGQRDLMDAHEQLNATHKLSAAWTLGYHGIRSGGLHVIDPGGNIDYDGKGRRASFVRWEDFRAR